MIIIMVIIIVKITTTIMKVIIIIVVYRTQPKSVAQSKVWCVDVEKVLCKFCIFLPRTNKTVFEKHKHIVFQSMLCTRLKQSQCMQQTKTCSTCPKMVKEGCVLFNHTLNTFYLWLYAIRNRVNDHSDIERGNLLPPHGLLFPINSKGSFICIIPQTG